MRVFIGGLPNSGTTHVAHLLMEAGLDFGSEVWPNNLHRKGMEWLPLRTWYLNMFHKLMGGENPTRRIFTITDEQRADYYAAHPLPSGPPDCVKIPDFGVHRLDEQWDTDLTIKVVRPKPGWVSSMMQWRSVGPKPFLEEVYDHVTGLWDGDIEVEWPRIINEPEYLEATLGEFGPVVEACETVTNPEWVTF